MPAGVIAAAALVVVVNGFPMRFDQPPLERAGRVYVPLRSLFERLGASVVYANGTINATRGVHTIQLRIGASRADVDGTPTDLDAPPFLAGNRALVPLRFIAQALGASIDYSATTRTVTIATVAPTMAPTAEAATPKATPTPSPAARPVRSSVNSIAELRPYYDQHVEPAFTVSGRTHPGSTVRVDAVASGRTPGQPWLRQSATSVTVVADDRGYFAATLSLIEFGFGIVDLHIVSVDPNGNSADVRSRARFGR